MNIETMLKILELSQRGVGGEAINATSLLNKLLKHHGMTIEDLQKSVDKKEVYAFSFDNTREADLFVQILFFVLQSRNIKAYGTKKRLWGLELNKADYMMIDYLYDVYRRDLNKEVNKLKTQHRKENKAILSAFIKKNELFVALPFEQKQKKSKTTIDWLTTQKLADQIEKSDVKKPINQQALELEYRGQK